MLCEHCGTEMERRDTLICRPYDYVGPVTMKVGAVVCDACGWHVLPIAAYDALYKEFLRQVACRLLKLPLGEFVPESEAAKILGVKPQDIYTRRGPERRKILDLVWSLEFYGSRLFHRRSLQRYLETGDGGFELNP